MLKYFNASKIVISRPLLPSVVLLVSLLATGCGIFGTKRKIEVPPVVGPLMNADKNRLIQEINRLSTVESIYSKVDIQFEDTSFASYGIADQYRLVDGTITLQRPAKIFLAIQFTFVDIAQMASDGEHFTVAVLKGEERYKRFVKGTNSADYRKLTETEAGSAPAKSESQKSQKETVNALSNLRPQHLTDAFMIRPIDPNSSLVYAQSEFFNEEADNRRGAKKGARIMRGYYLLEEFSVATASDAKLVRRFWLDRVGLIRLARVQTYDDDGSLITDVSYYNEKPLGSIRTASLPSRVEITRPQDQYKLSISYQDSNAVELNQPYKPEAFVLKNKWGLPEVDLDAQNKKLIVNQ